MIRVLFFATYQQITKKKKVNLEFHQGITVLKLKRIIIEQFPEIQNNLDNSIIAINQKFSNSNDIIPDDAEVAIFPQVSGGIDKIDICQISKHKLNINGLTRNLVNSKNGAVNIFLGVVRNTSRKNPGLLTKELFYQAYSEMAKAKLHKICEEIRNKWGLIDSIVIVQRIGRLKPGDIAAFIGCSAQHREDGVFEASRYAIDRLKQIVPIWKKEIGENGFAWVEGDYSPMDTD